MSRLLTSALIPACLGLLAARSAVAEKPSDPKPAAKKDVLAGHSYHGEAFNEGARQKAYLMGGTGNVTFPVTTSSSPAQRFINQGIGQLHGFWYFEAERSFRQAATIDPDCAMAYWGMAFANKGNVKRAKGFIAEAVKRKNNATEREVLYIDALDTFLKAKGSAGGKRGRALAAAFQSIAEKYPHDLEAKAFHGLYLYLTRNSKPRLKYENMNKVLQDVLAVNPLHPCHHYVIHLWDYKDAKRALPSSAACGESSPAIAHMWHMPGHIYSRLKRYRDAVWQQEASARVDHAHMIRDQVFPDRIHNFAHNNEWLIRNLIYVGRARDAMDLAKNMIELPRHPKYNTLAKRGSTYYGRLRLFQVLSEFELWNDLIALAKTPYLEPTDRDDQKLKRRRLLGRAWFATGDAKQGDAILTLLDAGLKKEQAGRNRAVQSAQAAFRRNVPLTALKPGQKPGKPQPRDFGKSLSSAGLRKQWNSARSRATRPFDAKIRSLEQAVNELKSHKAAARKDYKQALALLAKAGRTSVLDKARLQVLSGDAAAAVKALQRHVKSRKNEVLPLAGLVEALWKAGRKDEAAKQFAVLRNVAGQADLDVPALARLAPLATELQWPSDWRTPQPIAKDFGTRPPLDELGPFRWQPFQAADWSLKDVHGKVHSLKDYRGKPVIVIFYLGYGCLHCAEQLQAFAPKTEKYRKAGYSLIAISTDGQPELQKSHDNYKKGKFPFLLVSDARLDVFKKYRVYDDFEKLTLHGTFVIDGRGYVRWHDISFEPFMDPEFVLKEAQRLLGQSGSQTAGQGRKSPRRGAEAGARSGG